LRILAVRALAEDDFARLRASSGVSASVAAEHHLSLEAAPSAAGAAATT
jgi:hypothetical protein